MPPLNRGALPEALVTGAMLVVRVAAGVAAAGMLKMLLWVAGGRGGKMEAPAVGPPSSSSCTRQSDHERQTHLDI